MRSNKYSLILYVIAILIVFIPISIVLVTEYTFNASYSKIFINAAVILVIIGKILTVVENAKKYRRISWTGIGSIIGILIVLIWGVSR